MVVESAKIEVDLAREATILDSDIKAYGAKLLSPSYGDYFDGIRLVVRSSSINIEFDDGVALVGSEVC